MWSMCSSWWKGHFVWFHQPASSLFTFRLNLPSSKELQYPVGLCFFIYRFKFNFCLFCILHHRRLLLYFLKRCNARSCGMITWSHSQPADAVLLILSAVQPHFIGRMVCKIIHQVLQKHWLMLTQAEVLEVLLDFIPGDEIFLGFLFFSLGQFSLLFATFWG